VTKLKGIQQCGNNNNNNNNIFSIPEIHQSGYRTCHALLISAVGPACFISAKSAERTSVNVLIVSDLAFV
jgi:hypothetical protein